MAILTLAVAGFGLTGCGLKEPPPFDPLAIQQPEKTASRSSRDAVMPDLPTKIVDIATQPTDDNGNDITTQPTSTTQPVKNPHVHLRDMTAATTGPAIPENVIVRIPLQDIIQRLRSFTARK